MAKNDSHELGDISHNNSSGIHDNREQANNSNKKCGLKSKNPLNVGNQGTAEHNAHGISGDHPTSYVESLMHLFKGNIGTGLFAMGDAVKNAGIIAGPILTLAIAIISIHCQHILLNCSNKMQEITKCKFYPDFAETVEMCFANGPPKLRAWSRYMKTAVNIFICVTQLGFCCIYFVFISTNIKQILDHHEYVIDVRLLMLVIYIPILLPSLITNLKYLAPVSTIANVCMVSGITITMYFAFKDGLPHPSERNYFATWQQLPLFFGTAIFAFEGIALVLPLKNAMLKPKYFDRPLGVLNVGMSAATLLFIFAGFFGYLKWGEDVGGSLTLNLDVSNWLAQAVKIIVSFGVLLGYPIQFFIAIQILWPIIQKTCNIRKNHLYPELIFRTLMVLVTFTVAELVPQLNLFISLIGALCSTALALVFPPVIELIVSWENKKGPGPWIFGKNMIILLLALLGFSTGSYESISAIVKEFTRTS